jgi:hypothetical protein
MFTQQNRKSRQLLASGIKSTYDDDLYPTRLNFYREPPPLEISIEEFEQFALDRMQGTLFFTSSQPAFPCYQLSAHRQEQVLTNVLSFLLDISLN